jgi:hypothetical protein
VLFQASDGPIHERSSFQSPVVFECLHGTFGAAHYRLISMFDPRISNDTRREPLGFTSSGGDIDSETRHGFMSAPHISNDAGEEIMYGFMRYSFKIAATFCIAILVGERAFGLVPTKAPNGDLFVADATFGAVRVMRVLPGRTTPVRDAVFASRLNQPFGIAFYPLGSHPRWVYIANSDGVVRFRYRNGDLKATGKPEQIIAGIPTTHHYARDVVVSPDGHRLYFSVGSVHVQSVAAGRRNCEG